jgi:thiamine transport system permease protein
LTTSLELFGTTALIALVSAMGAAVIGYPVGNWLASLTGSMKRWLGAAILLPFLLPPFLVAMALAPLRSGELDSINGILWIIAAHLLMNIGFVARTVSSLAVPVEQHEAAELDGASAIQTRLQVLLPQQLPGLAAATLLVALYSATSYGLVLILGRGAVRTLETEIAQAALRELDLVGAGALALMQTLLTIALFLLARRLGAEPSPLFGDSYSPKSKLGSVFGLATLAAIGFLIWQVGSKTFLLGEGLMANLELLSTTGARDVLNISLIDAGLNSLRNLLVALLISVPIAWLLSGSKRARVWYLLPIGVSPVVFGLAFLVLSGYLPQSLRGWWIVPLVQSLFLIPLGYQILRPARQSIEPEIVEAATMDGAGTLRRSLSIEMPVLTRPMTGAVAFISLASLGEFGAASFLAYGSEATLPLVMYRLISRPGEENLAMAMTAALLFIALALIVVAAISREARTERRPSLAGR